MEPAAQSFYQYFPISERDRRWGLYVTTVGETRIGPEQPYPPPGHPAGYDFDWERGRVLQEHVIVYISRGQGWVEFEQVPPQRLETGTVLLLFPGVWHRYQPDRSTGWHEHWIGFDGEISRHWVAQGFFPKQAPVLKSGREDLLLSLFRGIMEMVRSHQPALQQVLAGVTSQILGQLYSAQQARLTGDDRELGLIQHALGRMQSELEANLSVQQLARDLKVSYSWFRRTFAQHTGSSPHRYLLELRLARARNLLADTTLSIKTVAQRTGFADEHYFSRTFKQKLGVAPTQWRENHQACLRTRKDPSA